MHVYVPHYVTKTKCFKTYDILHTKIGMTSARLHAEILAKAITLHAITELNNGKFRTFRESFETGCRCVLLTIVSCMCFSYRTTGRDGKNRQRKWCNYAI